jgi:hypothetical protein
MSYYMRGSWDDEVACVGNPYKLVRRGSDWCVVKAATGEIVPGGNHGGNKAKALAHFRALEINVMGKE